MTDKAQFDLPIVLPGVPDAADACVERLIARMRPRPGVSDVHVLPAIANEPAKLCIHYDPACCRCRPFAARCRPPGRKSPISSGTFSGTWMERYMPGERGPSAITLRGYYCRYCALPLRAA